MRTKTKSKNFYDDEVIGTYLDENNKKVIVLKPLVTRLHYYDYIDPDKIDQVNNHLIIHERYNKVNKLMFGDTDFESDN